MTHRRAVGLLSSTRDENWQYNRGGEGMTLVTTPCPDAEKKKNEKEKENRNEDTQPVIRVIGVSITHSFRQNL